MKKKKKCHKSAGNGSLRRSGCDCDNASGQLIRTLQDRGVLSNTYFAEDHVDNPSRRRVCSCNNVYPNVRISVCRKQIELPTTSWTKCQVYYTNP